MVLPFRHPLRIEFGWASHVGMIRSVNEDSVLALEPRREESPESTPFYLFAVADGMGGHEAGEIASKLALGAVGRSLSEALHLSDARIQPAVPRNESLLRALEESIRQANQEVYAEAQAMDNNMGTTLAAALVLGDTAYIANVGDSRVYLLAGKQMRQVSTDHSLVAAMVAAGNIPPERIYTHPRRNVITRCLGTQPAIQADLFVERLSPGHVLLICSDGLWEMVRDDRIRETILEAEGSQAACDQLVGLANANGGVDNVSVVIARLLA